MQEDHIHTEYVKGGFAKADEVVLSEASTTRVVFRPGLSRNGVRGHVIRQKIGSDGKWKDLNEVDFRSLPADSVVSIELDSDATNKLFQKLDSLYKVQSQGVAYGNQDYIVANAKDVVIVDDSSKKQAIDQLIAKGYSEEVWKALVKDNPSLATRLAAAKIQVDREDAIQEFERALSEHKADESYWERFFMDHPWMLQSVFSAAVFMLGGETYVGGKSAIGRQGKGGVATDFLFADESTKSFAVVEIKTPSTDLLGKLYRGDGDGLEQDVYSVHSELSGGVVQTRNQIAVAIDHFESVIGKTYKEIVSRIHPKGVLIIGTSDSLNDRQKESFNQFRHALYSLTVITFDELLRRLQVMFDCEPGDKTNRNTREPVNLDDIQF